jgi:hypothetical protein
MSKSKKPKLAKEQRAAARKGRHESALLNLDTSQKRELADDVWRTGQVLYAIAHQDRPILGIRTGKIGKHKPPTIQLGKKAKRIFLATADNLTGICNVLTGGITSRELKEFIEEHFNPRY